MLFFPNEHQIQESINKQIQYITDLKSPVLERLTNGILIKIPDYQIYEESPAKENLLKVQTYFLQKNKFPFFNLNFSNYKNFLTSELSYFIESDKLLIGIGDSPEDAKKNVYELNNKNCYTYLPSPELLISAKIPKLKKWAYIKLIRKDLSSQKKKEILSAQRQGVVNYILESFEQVSQQNSRFKRKKQRQGNEACFKIWTKTFQEEEAIQNLLNLSLNKMFFFGIHLQHSQKLGEKLDVFAKKNVEQTLFDFTLAQHFARVSRFQRMQVKLMETLVSDPNPEIAPQFGKKEI